ncbi:MAG: hypothetical protein NC393_04015 [Clostridium sp.]|nr:hypothetical protein [Clostridium sp.]MCM1171274.1 hypothetical protein [Clostridium sp.]MCM1207456.1 hypothetical protein [Ruminococcus sp.]
MKQYKIFKIIMIVFSGVSMLAVCIYSVAMVFLQEKSNQKSSYSKNDNVSNIVKLVLDGDSDGTLNSEYSKLSLEEKTEALEIMTAEMQKKIDAYVEGKVNGSFEEYVGEALPAFKNIIVGSYDVESEKLNEAITVSFVMDNIVYGQNYISEAENSIKKKDYAKAQEYVELVEKADETDEVFKLAGSIYECLCEEDRERLETVKTAIENEAGAYYIGQCEQLANEGKYSEIETLIEQVEGVCSEEDIAVMQGYVLTREKAFEMYLKDIDSYSYLFEGTESEFLYNETVRNFYGYCDVDDDGLNELIISNYEDPESYLMVCFTVDFDESEKKLVNPGSVGKVEARQKGVDWQPLNDSVGWRRDFNDFVLTESVRNDYFAGFLWDFDSNDTPELLINAESADIQFNCFIRTYINADKQLTCDFPSENTVVKYFIYKNNLIIGFWGQGYPTELVIQIYTYNLGDLTLGDAYYLEPYDNENGEPIVYDVTNSNSFFDISDASIVDWQKFNNVMSEVGCSVIRDSVEWWNRYTISANEATEIQWKEEVDLRADIWNYK